MLVWEKNRFDKGAYPPLFNKTGVCSAMTRLVRNQLFLYAAGM